MANIQLSANLKRLRTDHDYTQTKIAKMLNISRQAYSNYETGNRSPDLDMLILHRGYLSCDAGTAHHSDLHGKRRDQ